MKAGVARRRLLTLTAMGAAVVLVPKAWAETETVDGDVAKILAGRTAKSGKITLDIPAIAENGLVVPLNVDVESPMTAGDYVKAVHIIAAKNPNPLAVVFRFTPLSGKAAASTRIRLAETQDILAFAEMSNGDVYATKAEVKVTIGGCGG